MVSLPGLGGKPFKWDYYLGYLGIICTFDWKDVKSDISDIRLKHILKGKKITM